MTRISMGIQAASASRQVAKCHCRVAVTSSRAKPFSERRMSVSEKRKRRRWTATEMLRIVLAWMPGGEGKVLEAGVVHSLQTKKTAHAPLWQAPVVKTFQ